MEISFRRILAVLFFSIVTVCAFAQIDRVRDSEYYPRNELYIQYGTPTVMELVTVLSKDYVSGGQHYEGDSRNHKFSGVAGIGYNFSITPKLAMGIYGGISYSSADLYILHAEGINLKDPLKICRSNIMNYSGQLSATMIYWQRGPWECSGALYLGVAYLHETVDVIDNEYFAPEPDSRLKFAYHITPVKFRYGDEIGVFAELGFGYRGLLNVGLSIKI